MKKFFNVFVIFALVLGSFCINIEPAYAMNNTVSIEKKKAKKPKKKKTYTEIDLIDYYRNPKKNKNKYIYIKGIYDEQSQSLLSFNDYTKKVKMTFSDKVLESVDEIKNNEGQMPYITGSMIGVKGKAVIIDDEPAIYVDEISYYNKDYDFWESATDIDRNNVDLLYDEVNAYGQEFEICGYVSDTSQLDPRIMIDDTMVVIEIENFITLTQGDYFVGLIQVVDYGNLGIIHVELIEEEFIDFN